MKIRKAIQKEGAIIESIINENKDYFKIQGIDQWQNGYPNIDGINQDILKKRCYVVENEINEICATFVYYCGVDENYLEIEGMWQDNRTPYGILHRIAVAPNSKRKGIAQSILKFIERKSVENEQIYTIRIDTHESNLPMRELLSRNGYHLCGKITLRIDGSKRVAYEKSI